MSRSFSNAKQISAFISENISIALTRRGYASAGAVSGSKSGGVALSKAMLKKGGEESSKKSPSSSSWVPDPVTGVYRPENQVKEIDGAELRELIVNRKH